MPYIRRNQSEQLGRYMLESFEDRTLAHVKRFFPDKVEAMGEEAARESIREGIKKADDYHVLRERDVAKFIQLKFAIHEEWDEHEEMPWTNEILTDHSLSGEEKMNRINEQLPDRLKAMEKGSK